MDVKLGEFRIDNSAWMDFIQVFPGGAHIKDPYSKKYIYSNQKNLKIYGMDDPKDILGLTVNDLDQFMRPYWGNDFASKIENFDKSVLEQNRTLSENNTVFLDRSGLINIQNMTKIPILNSQNKVSAVLTTSFFITDKIDKFDLFVKYKEIYRKKREACFYFMRHLNITELFHQVLSEREMLCLLYMIENNTHRNLTQKMNISNKTVETHINNISNKLKFGTIVDLLGFLRNVDFHKND